jgi:hypothetical protein
MERTTQAFFDKMIKIFPSTIREYNNSIKENGELLETVVIEDIFMPEILKLLSEDKEKMKIQDTFDYIEEVINCDKHLRDILSITMMEILGNDSTILKTAKKYMGETSKKMQLEADKDLGRA